jgi:AcrR family transcriptional regulator
MARPATNHEVKKSEIVAAAIKSFARYGYEATTFKTIAQEGGFKSPATVYHYFPGGKIELFTYCLENFQPLLDFRHTIAEQEEPPEIYLRKLAHAYFGMLENELASSMMRIISAEFPHFPALAQKMAQKIAPSIIMPLATYLTRLIHEGVIKPHEPLTLAIQFMGPLFLRGYFLRQIEAVAQLPMKLPDFDQLIDLHIEVFLNGVKLEKEQTDVDK